MFKAYPVSFSVDLYTVFVSHRNCI